MLVVIFFFQLVVVVVLVVTAASLSLPSLSLSHLLFFSSPLSLSPSHPAIISIIIVVPPAHQPYYSPSQPQSNPSSQEVPTLPPRYTFSFPIRSSLRLPVCPIEFPLTAVRDQCFVQFSTVQFCLGGSAVSAPEPVPKRKSSPLSLSILLLLLLCCFLSLTPPL